MQFIEIGIEGAFVVEMEKREDHRGFFARSYCSDEFSKIGINEPFVQVNNSLSLEKGTLRGLHYQVAPFEEVKLVRAIQGEIYDVVLDLRPESATYRAWRSVILSSENRKMMVVPKGCAHGFYTLQENSELLYMVTKSYSPSHERGVRWDDPSFKIEWPKAPRVISDRDRLHPLFEDSHSLQGSFQ